MKAAVFYKPHEPLRVEDVETPKIGEEDLLVRVDGCGVCSTDLHYIEGIPTVKKPPLILGHEVSGKVAEVGRNVDDFSEGDEVLLPVLSTCGKCYYCRSGMDNQCINMKMLGNHIDGGFAEYVAFPAKDTLHLPKGIPVREACILADAVAVAYSALRRRASIKAGETLAVYGCGGLGLNFVQMGKAFGATVIAIDINEKKLELAKKLGADETINASEQDPVKEIRRISGMGVDVAAEVIGKPQTIKNAFESVKPAGRVLVVGFTPENLPINAGRLMFREISVHGALGCPKSEYIQIFELLMRGKISLEPLISHRYSLDEINTAFEKLKNGEILGRAIIIP